MTLTGLIKLRALQSLTCQKNPFKDNIANEIRNVEQTFPQAIVTIETSPCVLVVSMLQQYVGKIKYTKSSASIFDVCLDGVFAR